MELKFLGSGAAFTMSNRHSNMLLTHNEKNLLIDCGSDIRHSIAQAGLSHRDIDAVYISHLHGDHVGGMEWLALYSYFDPAANKVKLFINASLKEDIWNRVLSAGLSTIEGVDANLTTYFILMDHTVTGAFEWEGIQFQMIQTVHTVNGHLLMPSFGLMFKLNDKLVFLTTDTQFCPNQIKVFYHKADLIFHDCETTGFKSGVHAHYDDLKTLPVDIKRKMWLYHYQDEWLYHYQDTSDQNNVKDGFLGFIQKGQVFK